MDRIKLETKHVSIEFPGVKALDDINFEVTTGEIRAVVGANGAGKSTLMKVLAGANSTYTGDVLLNGKNGGGKDTGGCQEAWNPDCVSGSGYGAVSHLISCGEHCTERYGHG